MLRFVDRGTGKTDDPREHAVRVTHAIELRGMGDRWLAGETIEGVDFPLHARVRITTGRHAGKLGSVAFLMNLDTDPLYLVELLDGTGDVRVRGTGLRSEETGPRRL